MSIFTLLYARFSRFARVSFDSAVENFRIYKKDNAIDKFIKYKQRFLIGDFQNTNAL